MPNSGPGAIEGAGELRNDLRASERGHLAATIAHPKMAADIRRFAGTDECDRCVRALDAADALLADGWVRVVEDDDTIQTVAVALAAHDGYGWPADREGVLSAEVDYDLDRAVARPGYYLDRSRAVVRALREET